MPVTTTVNMLIHLLSLRVCALYPKADANGRAAYAARPFAQLSRMD